MMDEWPVSTLLLLLQHRTAHCRSGQRIAGPEEMWPFLGLAQKQEESVRREQTGTMKILNGQSWKSPVKSVFLAYLSQR